MLEKKIMNFFAIVIFSTLSVFSQNGEIRNYYDNGVLKEVLNYSN
jgi:antitoxin component YwqK of YwqJK toxin-antitoxin module